MKWNFIKRVRLRKWHKIVGIIVLSLILLLIFLPSIAKWYINSNGEKLIGRKVSIDGLHINYFRCSVDIEKFVLYEKNGKDIFVSFDELYVNFAPWHLLKKEYAFTEIYLINPIVSLIHSNGKFNFDDLANSDDSTKTEEKKDTTPSTVRYLIQNLTLKNGYIRYEDKSTKSITELKALGISIPEIAWNNNESKMGINFILGEKGKVALDGKVNQAAGTYSIRAKTSDIDISPFIGYTSPYMALSNLNGLFYSDIIVNGEMANPMNIKIFGDVGIKSLLINDKENKHFFSANDIYVKMDSLDIAKENYCINTLKIDSPSLTTEIFNGGNNFDKILAPYYADSLNADTTHIDTTQSNMHYSVQNILINNCSIAFTDLTLNRPFKYDISNLNLNINGYSDEATSVIIDYDMILNNAGTLKGKADIDFLTMKNMNVEGVFANLDMIGFSPYSEYYIARPITKGAFNYDFKIAMTPTHLNNQNSIKIVSIETGKKLKEKGVYKVPIGLALYVLKDRNDIIAFDLPVSGNPSSPTFKLGKIIWKTLEEFLLKAATAPFKALSNTFGINPESIKQIPFDFLQDSLEKYQKSSIDKIAEIITAKPELIFVFSQSTDSEKEKQMLAVEYAKKMFITSTINSSDQNAIMQEISRTRDNDPEFRNWLGMGEFDGGAEVPEYALKKIGVEKAKILLDELMAKREKAISNYFIFKGTPQNAIQFKIADLRNLPEDLKKPMFAVEINME